MLVRMPIRRLSKQYRKKRKERFEKIIWVDKALIPLIHKKDNSYDKVKLLSAFVYL